MSVLTVTGLSNPVSIIDQTDGTKKVQFVTSGITTGNTRLVTIPDSNVTIVDLSLAQTLTNKTIVATSNSISALADANIASSAAINATKIGNGDVTSAMLSYLNTISSNVQTQINGKAATVHTHVHTDITDFTTAVNGVITTQAGAVNGLATLNSSGKVPASQLAITSLTYQGSWNASTNTPTLASGVGTAGYFYIVSVAGNTTLDTYTGWLAGDWAVYNAGTWERIAAANSVTSVAGKTGAVTLAAGDITSGTFANSLIAASNVTQWVGSLNIQSLSGAPSGTVVGTSDSMTLTNKSLNNTSCFHVDNADPTKRIAFSTASNTTGITLTISSQQTTSQTILVPNLSGTDTIVTLAASQTLTNKTLTNPVISTIVNGGNSLTVPASNDTLVGRNTTDTLTNKSFTNANCAFVDGTDATKKIYFQSGAATTSTNLTIINQQTTSQSLSVPNLAASDTIMTLGTTQTITGSKIFTNATLLVGGATLYNTGTMSQSTTTVTGVGTTFTSSMVGGVIIYANGSYAFITAVTNTTTLVVSQSATVTSQAYSLYYGAYQQDNAGNIGIAKINVSSLSVSMPVFTDANKNLVSGSIGLGGSQITGTLGVANGGTGLATLTSGYFLQGNGTGTVNLLKVVPSGVVVGTTDTQLFTNKTLTNANCSFVDSSDNTKQIGFISSSATTATTLTIASIQTTTQTLTIPNISTADTLMTTGTQQTIAGAKTFTSINGLFGVASTYTAGTASQSSITITGSSTTFTSQMVGGVILFANGTQAFVTAYGSATSLTVSQSATVTNQAYVLYYGGTQADNSGNIGAVKMNVSSLSASLPVVTDANKNLISANINLSNQVSNTLPVTSGGTGATTLQSGYLLQGNGTAMIQSTKACPTGAIIGDSDSQTLTNKTINATNNTITNITNSSIASNAGIVATALGNGDVSNTQLSYLNSTTSNVQTQLNNLAATFTTATVTTNGTTVTTLATLGTISNTTYSLNITVAGRRTDAGTESATYSFIALYRNNAGTVTPVGQDKVAIQDNAAWACSLSVSSTNIILSVAGASAQTVNWIAWYKAISV